MNHDKTFPRQEAPAKNTDGAFVKVAEDGSPDAGGANEQESKLEEIDNEQVANAPGNP